MGRSASEPPPRSGRLRGGAEATSGHTALMSPGSDLPFATSPVQLRLDDSYRLAGARGPRTLPSARSAFPAALLLGMAACGPADAADRQDLSTADVAVIRLGAQVYRAQCASCHGNALQGAADWKRMGVDGRLPPPPHDSTGHTWHHADGLLFRIVARGTAVAIGDTARTSRYGMPAFASQLSPVEMRAVLTYLKTTWTPDQRRRQTEASRDDPLPGATGRP